MIGIEQAKFTDSEAVVCKLRMTPRHISASSLGVFAKQMQDPSGSAIPGQPWWSQVHSPLSKERSWPRGHREIFACWRSLQIVAR